MRVTSFDMRQMGLLGAAGPQLIDLNQQQLCGTTLLRSKRVEVVMLARDVMVSPVITISPSAKVREAAKLLLDNRISAVPVLDQTGNLVGIISEGDLLHRVEAGTERRRSWWLTAFAANDTLAAEFIKAHAQNVSDVMTDRVIAATPDTPLQEIAATMEKHAIKRIPIVEHGQLVGIVSRANLLQAVASSRSSLELSPGDRDIRERILSMLKSKPWAHTLYLSVTVVDGVVDLWGVVDSGTERKAINVAASSVPGVVAVNDNLVMRNSHSWE